MKVNIIASTDGSGLWSNHIAAVEITDLYISYIDDDEDFGELRAYFSTDNWSVRNHGLIYTDKKWMKEFREALMKLGFSKEAVEDVDYSEQGMQGRDYVSMDIGDKFYKKWLELGGEKYEETEYMGH